MALTEIVNKIRKNETLKELAVIGGLATVPFLALGSAIELDSNMRANQAYGTCDSARESILPSLSNAFRESDSSLKYMTFPVAYQVGLGMDLTNDLYKSIFCETEVGNSPSYQ
jgi:hypothetical protein